MSYLTKLDDLIATNKGGNSFQIDELLKLESPVLEVSDEPTDIPPPSNDNQHHRSFSVFETSKSPVGLEKIFSSSTHTGSFLLLLSPVETEAIRTKVDH